MAYLSLYRKYRSQTFADLVGQEHVVRTLQNAIGSAKIAHAYLFTGPRGTGKTSTARLLAKALCCENGPTAEPCNTCETCRSITEGSHVDIVEMDAASESGVDEVRESIVEVAEYRPAIARYKVFIIDEVHDLSAKAFDALLKTIEEPPEHLIFILATTEFHKVPATIRSRCQKFEFHRGSVQDVESRLRFVAESEGAAIEPAALTALARMADGGYRDALTLLEQATLSAEGPVTLEHVYDQLGLIADDVVDTLLFAMREGEVASLLEQLAELARRGRDPRAVLESMLHRLADLTRAAYGLELGTTADAAREAATRDAAVRVGRERLLSLRAALADAHKTVRDVTLPRLWLEAELVRLATERPPAQTAPARTEVRESPSRPHATNGGAPAAAEPPAAKTKPTAPEEPPAAKTKPPVPAQPAQAPPADPKLAKAQKVWDSVVADLSKLSKSMAMKLAGSRVGALEGGVLTVEFERQMDRDWVLEVPKRTAAIQDMVASHAKGEVRVEFVARKRGPAGDEGVRTVELPAEGERLHKMANDILGGRSED